jgi:hypothetical protein
VKTDFTPRGNVHTVVEVRHQKGVYSRSQESGVRSQESGVKNRTSNLQTSIDIF